MTFSRNTFYWLIASCCLAGYAWVFITYPENYAHYQQDSKACLVKHFTGIPCPSCGSTRSVLAFFHEDFAGAFYWNPLGLLLVLIMLITPVWLLYDGIGRKSTLFRFYQSSETFLKKKQVAITAIALVLINWSWNIYKGL